MTRANVSVIICAYSTRRAPTLQAAAKAVREQLMPGDELLLVIDHNQDLLEILRSTLVSGADEHPPLRLIANHNARGLSGARNAGVAAALGELVAFLDDDAVPRGGWLEQLVEPFCDPEVIGVGGIAAPAWEATPPGWLPAEFLWVVGCSYRGLPRAPAEIRNPIGANMAFRRQAIHEAGGFTDGVGRIGRTPLGCEETEFSIRAARVTGGRIVQQPAATVDHLVTADRLRLRYFVHRCWAEGISKAVIARLTSGAVALASERTYTTRTLPAGVWTGIRDGLDGDRSGFGRAAAIVGGLFVTTAGYIRGTATTLPTRRVKPVTENAPAAERPAFTPTWSGELDLAAPALPEYVSDASATPFERARLMIRAAGTPLGFLALDTPGGRLELSKVVGLASAAFEEQASEAVSDTAWATTAGAPVSIVLCTRNRPDGARRTLESLLALEHREIEVLVVDNAPQDDSTRRVVAELSRLDPRLRYVREDRPGLSCARNRGLSEATHELIAFTDDDVRVDPLWLHGILRGFARRPDVACVTGLVASSSLSHPAEQYFDQRVWWSSSCEHRLFTRHRGPADSALHPYTPGIFGTGANFACRASVVRSLGGFDQCLGAGSPTRGGEDLDFFVRLILASHALSYEPSALVWHDHRVDEASLRAQMYAYGLGLTAYVTKYLLAGDARKELTHRLLGGAWYAVRLLRRSRHAGEAAGLEPVGMASVELRGMLAGPVAYLRARRSQDRAHLMAVRPRSMDRTGVNPARPIPTRR